MAWIDIQWNSKSILWIITEETDTWWIYKTTYSSSKLRGILTRMLHTFTEDSTFPWGKIYYIAFKEIISKITVLANFLFGIIDSLYPTDHLTG